MSHSERWQEMFGPPGEEPAMWLASAAASAPGPGASGTGNLKHSKGPWTSASGTAGELRWSWRHSSWRPASPERRTTTGIRWWPVRA
ncbi:hypothetical protein F5983_30315 [Streptomyces arboris]|uniref:Uncharacterized protein n=1 Tax=Streptomyces arboris TaxID=2600619 RepID=A0A5N5EGJ7_9ACTN|nr:hypothetical protein F5983_30315 [Streptomyces arboris]